MALHYLLHGDGGVGARLLEDVVDPADHVLHALARRRHVHGRQGLHLRAKQPQRRKDLVRQR